MSRYEIHRYQQIKERRWKVHPIWRGIGCVFVVLIPLMSILAARVLNVANLKSNFLHLPAEMLTLIDFTVVYQYTNPVTSKLPGLVGLVNTFVGLKIYKLEALLTIAFLVFGFGFLAVLYSSIYSALGPSRYGPVDAPPIRKSPRKGIGRAP